MAHGDVHGRRSAPEIATDTVVLLASAYLAAFANTAFWQRALAGRPIGDWHTWSFAAAVAVILVAVHFLVVVPFATRRTVRPLLVALVLLGVSANYFMQRYGIVLDAGMVRNVVHTDPREAAEFFTWDALAWICASVLPTALLWKLRIRTRPMRSALARRTASMAAAFMAATCALLLVYQDLSALMRTHKTLRYTINPAGPLWSFGQLVAADAHASKVPRDPPEPARRHPAAGRRKPTLLVVVVGETARAANFSLNGYARPTNPELARLDVINFAHVRACGTSTEVSVPCMFSPFGRTDYDEVRIRRHESLLHVLSHAGFRVVWLDNQSGCKGVCDGLDYRDLSHESLPGICSGGRCYDEILSHELARLAERASGDLVVVLHQLGNHGPAYFRRYPEELKRFTPACESEQLRDCSADEIVNAYDNAIAYTDRFLADIIGVLDRARARFDVAMLYVSDHGESLGEMGLYLHGLPYGIAPSEQLLVPMLWWIPTESAADLGLDLACVRSRSTAEASHDNLYHSVLGLLDVDTPLYRKTRDLVAGCRAAPAQQQAQHRAGASTSVAAARGIR
ncbi:MAG: phosphoethanolamine--lipid A transferase [Betaproteobacteria bacterium]|nr:MAG: phosphoethanolamine--lipid A transferase [Betaproteobacteria bacterium]